MCSACFIAPIIAYRLQITLDSFFYKNFTTGRAFLIRFLITGIFSSLLIVWLPFEYQEGKVLMVGVVVGVLSSWM